MLGIINNINKPNSINTLYEDIQNKIYNSESEVKSQILIHNLTPIKYKNMKLLVTSFNGLEHLFLEKGKKIIIKYFIDKDNHGDIILQKYLNLLDIKKLSEDNFLQYDSFYDEHTNLLFIKFQDICIKYFDLDNINIDRLIYDKLLDENIYIKFIDHTINSKVINDKISSNYIFSNKFLSLPPIPYLTIDTNNDKFPFKGSLIVDENNNLIGIVNNLINHKIIIIPLLNIIRSLKYLECKVIKSLFFDYKVIRVKSSKLETSRIRNDFYALMVTNFIGDKKGRHGKIFQKNNLIYSINDNNFDNEGNIVLEGVNIPIYTYLWLKMIKNVNINFISNSLLNNINFEEENIILEDSNFVNICYKTRELCLKKLDKINNIKTSRLNYLNTNDIYIFELNEKILSIIKNYMIENKELDPILDKIYNYRYSEKSKNILLYLRIKKNKHVIDIIEEYNSIQSLEKKLSKLSNFEINFSGNKLRLLKI
jgi:hypothetical protein